MRAFPAALLVVLLAPGIGALAETATKVEVVAPPSLEWEARFQGVDYATFTLDAPRPMVCHVLRVDLSADGVALITNDDNGDRPEETDGAKTSTFVGQTGCQAAVNGAPFWPIHAEEGLPQNVAGIVISEGELVSPDFEGRPGLIYFADRSAAIGLPAESDDVVTAVGGFWSVLRDGEVVDVGESVHPRTAAGVSEDGRTVWLLVVDGRQPGYSEGARSDELGSILKSLGADDGLNLDGGGTTAMAIEGPDGEPVVFNRPINGGVPGQERVSASHLGVRAVRLKD
ncbi:MAG: phosphodiester glycosidase family protein [Planctomycetota bacterium]